MKWRKELISGQYYDLLNKGFIKPDEHEPEINGLGFYFDAFRELSTSRQIGMEVGSIPFTAIVEYSKIYELGDLDEFLYIIRRMDETFLEMSRSASGKGKNAAVNSGPKNRDRR